MNIQTNINAQASADRIPKVQFSSLSQDDIILDADDSIISERQEDERMRAAGIGSSIFGTLLSGAVATLGTIGWIDPEVDITTAGKVVTIVGYPATLLFACLGIKNLRD